MFQSFASSYTLQSRLVDIHRMTRWAFDRGHAGVLQVRLGRADLFTMLSLSVHEQSFDFVPRLFGLCAVGHTSGKRSSSRPPGEGCFWMSRWLQWLICLVICHPLQPLSSESSWRHRGSSSSGVTLPPGLSRRQRAGPQNPHREPHPHTAWASALACSVWVPLLVLRP